MPKLVLKRSGLLNLSSSGVLVLVLLRFALASQTTHAVNHTKSSASNCSLTLFAEPSPEGLVDSHDTGSGNATSLNATSTQGNHSQVHGNSSLSNSSSQGFAEEVGLDAECSLFLEDVLCPEYSLLEMQNFNQTAVCKTVEWDFCCEPYGTNASKDRDSLRCCKQVEVQNKDAETIADNQTNTTFPCDGQACPASDTNRSANQCSSLSFNETVSHLSCLERILECRMATPCLPRQYPSTNVSNSTHNGLGGGDIAESGGEGCDTCCAEFTCPVTRGRIRCCAVEVNQTSDEAKSCVGEKLSIHCEPLGIDPNQQQATTTTMAELPETTPLPDDDETEAPIVIRENLTIINITTKITELLKENATNYDGGLNEELQRLVDAFRDPQGFFLKAEGLDPVAIYTLWTTFAIFMLGALAIAYDRSRYKLKHQSNHNMLILIAIVSCFCYLSMANGHGRVWRHRISDVTPRDLGRFCNRSLTLTRINVSAGETEETFCEGGTVVYRWLSADVNFERVPLDPPFFYGKYVQWLFTTNITLYLLCVSIANAKIRVTIFVLVCNSMMILCGLLAASMRTEGVDQSAVPRFIISRWVYWVCGMMFYVLLLSVLNRAVRRAANSRRSRPLNAAIFNQIFFVLCLGWSLYPFAWTVTEGFSALSFRTETYTFCVLDLGNKIIFTVLFLIRVPQVKHLLPGANLGFLTEVKQPCLADEVPGGDTRNEFGSMTPQERKGRRNRNSNRHNSVTGPEGLRG